LIRYTIVERQLNINHYRIGDGMGEQNVMNIEELMSYEAPQMEKHDPIKAVQGSGDHSYYCYGYYNYYYRTYYYYC